MCCVRLLVNFFLQQSSRCVYLIHTRYMFQPNTTIYYTELCSRQPVSTLMSHHQAILLVNETIAQNTPGVNHLKVACKQLFRES